MALFMLACGAPALVAAHLLVARRRAAGSLGRQFATAVALTVGLVMLGVFAVALLMFISGHDALVMAVLLLLAGGLVAYTTWLLSRDVIAQRDAAESARRDLVAAVSHDLRTPLTSLRLLSEAIEDDLVERDDAAPLRRADVAAHPLALGAGRGPVRALAPRGGRHPVVAAARCGSTSSWRRPSRRCAPRPTPATWQVRAAVPDATRAGPGQPREAPARAVQPDPERHPPHPGRRQRDRGGRGERPHGRGGGGRHRRGPAAGRARARLRALLPRRRGRGALGRRHRARAHDLPRDRGGPRRRDLVRRLRHAARACASASRAPPERACLRR